MDCAGRIAVCLVLGAVTTLAVAWVFAVRMTVPVPGGTHVSVEGFQRDPSTDTWYWCQVKERPGLTVVVWELSKTFPHLDHAPDVAIHPQDIRVWVLDPAKQSWSLRVPKASQLPIDPRAIPAWARAVAVNPQVRGLTMASARGWPMRALWYEAQYVAQRQGVSGGVELPANLHWLGPIAILPCRPIAGGMAVDSVLYAALWSVVLYGPGRVRRIIRRHRGLCPGCGYDLAHGRHDRCPECGFERKRARR